MNFPEVNMVTGYQGKMVSPELANRMPLYCIHCGSNLQTTMPPSPCCRIHHLASVATKDQGLLYQTFPIRPHLKWRHPSFVEYHFDQPLPGAWTLPEAQYLRKLMLAFSPTWESTLSIHHIPSHVDGLTLMLRLRSLALFSPSFLEIRSTYPKSIVDRFPARIRLFVHNTSIKDMMWVTSNDIQIHEDLQLEVDQDMYICPLGPGEKLECTWEIKPACSLLYINNTGHMTMFNPFQKDQAVPKSNWDDLVDPNRMTFTPSVDQYIWLASAYLYHELMEEESKDINRPTISNSVFSDRMFFTSNDMTTAKPQEGIRFHWFVNTRWSSPPLKMARLWMTWLFHIYPLGIRPRN
jgi:hypothetical protein